MTSNGPLNDQKTALVEKRLRWAGLFIGLGLAVQLLTFVWIHTFAFMAFALIACPLLLAGILVYLYTLAT